jgi:hypothetical protein
MSSFFALVYNKLQPPKSKKRWRTNKSGDQPGFPAHLGRVSGQRTLPGIPPCWRADSALGVATNNWRPNIQLTELPIGSIDILK